MDQIIFRNLVEIVPLPGNAKDHDIPDIQGSIRDYGFADPIGVNPNNNYDLDGNGRLEALLLMFDAGEPCPRFIRQEDLPDGSRRWWVPTVDLDYDDETQHRLAVRLNASNLKKGFLQDKLLTILERAKEQGKLSQTGFDETGLYTVRTLVEQACKQAEQGNPNDAPPGQFQTFSPDTIQVDYVCPNCKYGWSGKPKPTGDAAGANIQPVTETAASSPQTAPGQQETNDGRETTLPNQQAEPGQDQ